MIKNYALNLYFALLLTCFAHAAFSDAGRPDKPNVLLLLTDDLGWQDVKVYDIDEPSPYDTPHIDALAEKGVMFWQGYSPAPTCAPSRCAIMSGNHPARAQKTHVVGGWGKRGQTQNIKISASSFTRQSTSVPRV